MSSLPELIARIQFDHAKRQQNRIYESLPISIFDPKIVHEKLTTDLNGHLVQSQLLINSLLGMRSKEIDRKPLISLSRKIYQKNRIELKIIDEFERDYAPNHAIRWYTRESFVSRILNKALRTQNIDLLFLFQFFILDIRQQLEKSRHTTAVQVYRRQLMSRDEFKLLKNAKGQFISINSFLSATINRDDVMDYDERNDELRFILFEIHADPKPQDTKPFANIKKLGFNHEDEFLFMIGSIFQIIAVDSHQGEFYRVRLKLCTDNSEQLNAMSDDDNLLSFGHVLMTMGKIDEAQIYYQRLSEQLSENHIHLARCFRELALIAEKKGEYDTSIHFYEKALEANSKISTSSFEAASNYTGLGEVCRQKRDFPRALHNYHLALHVLQTRSPDESLSQTATIRNHIGTILHEQEKYEEAIEQYKQAIEIHEKRTPIDETFLGMLNNNIGNAYFCLHKCDSALQAYKKALFMYKKTLPADHPKFASTYNNMGALCQEQGRIQEALAYFKDALKIYAHMYPSTHPNVVTIQKNIDRLSGKERRWELIFLSFCFEERKKSGSDCNGFRHTEEYLVGLIVSYSFEHAVALYLVAYLQMREKRANKLIQPFTRSSSKKIVSFSAS